MSDPVTITLDVRGCARCHGDGHPGLEFKALTNPVERPGGLPPLTHWATCPTNGEPILMLVGKRRSFTEAKDA